MLKENMTVDQSYQHMLSYLLSDGERVTTRNSTVQRIFPVTTVFDSTPLVSVRKTAWKQALREFEWFMSGSCNINDLHHSLRSWWQPWADQHGNILFNYSEQFRRMSAVDPETGFPYQFDQVAYLLDGIKQHPYSRRNAITTWNTPEMVHKLCPISNCHGSWIQAFVELDNNLHLMMVQRSVDVICGLPHNWLQYWAFLLWLAHHGGRKVGSLTWIGGDVHLYDAHQDLARRIVEEPAPLTTPQLVYTATSEVFRADDFKLDGEYSPVVTEKAEMVV